MLAGLGFVNLASTSVGPRDQAIEVVTIGAVSAESFLVKQTLDTAAEADLVGVTLGAHRPAQLAVPATAEQHHASTSQPGSQET